MSPLQSDVEEPANLNSPQSRPSHQDVRERAIRQPKIRPRSGRELLSEIATGRDSGTNDRRLRRSRLRSPLVVHVGEHSQLTRLPLGQGISQKIPATDLRTREVF